MAYIITSKTRSKIMRQPRERMKALTDRRAVTAEKHGVVSVTPTIGVSEEEIHSELDKQGSGVSEAMEANREIEREKTKLKQLLREEKRHAIAKQRLSIMEERDRRNGVQEKVKRFKHEQSKTKGR